MWSQPHGMGVIEIGTRTGDGFSSRRNTLSGEEKP